MEAVGQVVWDGCVQLGASRKHFRAVRTLTVVQASRFPQDSFSSVKLLQGAPYKSDAVEFYKKISSADVVETDRHTAALRMPKSRLTLVACQFAGYIDGIKASVP